MISVVILNWKRPYNIKNDILPKIINYNLVSEVIISHGKSETYFQTPGIKMVKHYRDENLNPKLGVALRFLRSCNAKNECILILDDDRLPSEEYVNKMYELFQKDKNVIIGTVKRYVSPKGYSNKEKNVANEKKIILTQVLMTNKKICKDFINEKEKMNDLALKAKPVWNGEDILFNLIYIKNYNKTPIHLEPKNNELILLKDNDAISSNTGHFEYRKKFSKTALERYELNTNTYNIKLIISLIILLVIIIYLTK
jgi:hypothetical protein